MSIEERNQRLVARHVAGETLASVAREFGISRERARQVFRETATKDEIKQARIASRPVKAPKKDNPDYPRGEKRVRLASSSARKITIPQAELRIGIKRWLSGEIKIQDTIGAGRLRFEPQVSIGMNDKLVKKCDKEGISISTALRGVAAFLENENETHRHE